MGPIVHWLQEHEDRDVSTRKARKAVTLGLCPYSANADRVTQHAEVALVDYEENAGTLRTFVEHSITHHL
jgi:hypothetical protein